MVFYLEYCRSFNVIFHVFFIENTDIIFRKPWIIMQLKVAFYERSCCVCEINVLNAVLSVNYEVYKWDPSVDPSLNYKVHEWDPRIVLSLNNEVYNWYM